MVIEMFCVLSAQTSIQIVTDILPVVLQDVSTGATWVKDTQDFSGLFLRNACMLQLSANLILI